MELTPTETTLITIVRTLKPLETLIVRSDPQGKPHKFMVNRVYTAWVEQGKEKPVVEKVGVVDLQNKS